MGGCFLPGELQSHPIWETSVSQGDLPLAELSVLLKASESPFAKLDPKPSRSLLPGKPVRRSHPGKRPPREVLRNATEMSPSSMPSGLTHVS